MSILAPSDIEAHFPEAPKVVQATMRNILEIHAATMASIADLDPNGDLHKKIRRFESVTANGNLTRRLFANTVVFDDPLSILGGAMFHLGTVEWERTGLQGSPDIKREENIFINKGQFSVGRKSTTGVLEAEYGNNFNQITDYRTDDIRRTPLSESNAGLTSLLVRFHSRLKRASRLHAKLRSQSIDLIA